jgi:hypothetical protein
MKTNQNIKTFKDIITPEKKVDIPLSSVQFSKSWTFWESYAPKIKSKEFSYDDANKQVFKWHDLIAFFQFWNKYPGNDIKNIFFDGNNVKFFFNEKYRINSMNIFKEDIKPMWEDEKNIGGNYFQLEYKVQKDKIAIFINAANHNWKKLVLSTMGGELPYSDYINGIRFVDKTDFERGKIIMFRIEVWVDKELKEDKLEELKGFLSKNYGCEEVTIKKIKSK